MEDALNFKENYMTPNEAAKALGITRNRVGRLCLEGRFSGAFKVGRSWIIPKAAVFEHHPAKPGELKKARQELLSQQ